MPTRAHALLYVPAITGPFAGSLGEQTSTYIERASKKQTVDGHITLLSSLAPGFGAYDVTRPVGSPEGDVLLHETGAVLGLGQRGPDASRGHERAGRPERLVLALPGRRRVRPVEGGRVPGLRRLRRQSP